MGVAARSLIAAALLVGVFVLPGVLVAGLAAALVQAGVHGLGPAVVVPLSVVLAALLVLVGRAGLVVHRAGLDDGDGVALGELEQPLLWAEVRGLAAATGARPPDELRLVPGLDVAVHERVRLLGLAGGHRVLHLGAAVLCGLSRQQLRALLAHELAHDSHRNSAATLAAYRGHRAIQRLLAQLGPRSLTARVVGLPARAYLGITRPGARRLEVEADAWSHRLAGHAAAATALRQCPTLALRWAHFLDFHVFRLPHARPERLYQGFQWMLASLGDDQLCTAAEAGTTAPQAAHDTHPPLRDRLASLRSLPTRECTGRRAEDDRPALTLVADVDRVLAVLERWMFRDSGRTSRSLEWIARQAGRAEAYERAALLVAPSDHPDRAAVDLGEAISAIGAGRGHLLVRHAAADDATPQRLERTARSLVASAVAAALVDHTGARFTMSYDPTNLLVDADAQVIDVHALVGAVTDARSADQLCTVLASKGVPLSFAVGAPPEERRQAS